MARNNDGVQCVYGVDEDADNCKMGSNLRFGFADRYSHRSISEWLGTIESNTSVMQASIIIVLVNQIKSSHDVSFGKAMQVLVGSKLLDATNSVHLIAAVQCSRKLAADKLKHRHDTKVAWWLPRHPDRPAPRLLTGYGAVHVRCLLDDGYSRVGVYCTCSRY